MQYRLMRSQSSSRLSGRVLGALFSTMVFTLSSGGASAEALTLDKLYPSDAPPNPLTPGIHNPQLIPDPVPLRNGRTGLVALPPDRRHGTVKTGLFPVLGYFCVTCRHADVWGGDVAVSWDDGRGGTFIIFGDSIGKEYGKKARVRSNTLAYTRDRFFLDGIRIDEWVVGKDGKAKEAIPSLHKNGFERSKIPTGAFSYRGVQYVGWQSVARIVRDSRRWTTSRSGLSASYDHGKNWHTVFTRPQGHYYKFQQVSYTIKGDFLYEFGTRQGRENGGIAVARVPLTKITDLSAREYWTGLRWVKGAADWAFPVIRNVRGEISVQYDPTFRRFNMLRMLSGQVILSTSLDGVIWSPGRSIYSSGDSIYSLYSPQLLPNRVGADLHFLLSSWQDYNVVSMYTPLGI